MGRYSDLLDTKEPAALPGQAPTSGRYSSLFDEPAADLAAVDVQPERTLTGTLGDVATTVAKGVVAVPEAMTGLADIPTGGLAGKALEDAGVDFGQMQEGLDQYLSPAQKAAQQKVTDADGFVGKLKAAVTNPSTIAVAVGESLPLMLTGGAAGRLLGSVANLAKTSVLPAAFGEGVMAAGSAAEGIRQQADDGLLTGKQALLAGGAGAGTALFGFLGGKVAQKLGIADVDIAAAGGDVAAAATNKGITRRAIEGAFTEGVLEELPQSVQEQMLNNIALEKDVWDGVDEAAAMGMLAGAAMGGPFAAVSPGKPAAAPPPKDEIDQRIDAIDRQTQVQTGQIADPDLKATVDAMLNEARRGPTAEVPVYDAEVVQDRAPKPAALPPVDERLALPEPTVINAGGPINLPSDRGGYFYGTRDEGQTGNEPLVAAVVDLDRKIANLESLPEAARTDTAQANLERLTQERQALLTTLKERTNDLPPLQQSRVEAQPEVQGVRPQRAVAGQNGAEIQAVGETVADEASLVESTAPGTPLPASAPSPAEAAQPAASPVAPAPAVTPPVDNPQAAAIANLTAPVSKGRGKNKGTEPNGTAFTITDPNFPGREKYVFTEDTKGNLSIVKPDGTVQKASEGIANRVFLAKKQGMTAPYVAPQADPLASQPEAPTAVAPAPVAPVVSQGQPEVSSKQPWQMTPAEFAKEAKTAPHPSGEAEGHIVFLDRASNTKVDRLVDTFNREQTPGKAKAAAHRYLVEQAVSEGLPVPPEVLAKIATKQKPAQPSFTTYTPQPGDVAAKSGPFKTQKQAQNRRTAGLVKTHDVVAVAGGYVLRPNVETATIAAVQNDPRLKRKAYRGLISDFVAGNTQVSGSRKDGGEFVGQQIRNEANEVVGRVPSPNMKALQPAIELAGGVQPLRTAVDKAAKGVKLGIAQARAVKLVLDAMTDQRRQLDNSDRRDMLSRVRAAAGRTREIANDAPELTDADFADVSREDYPEEWTAETATMADLARVAGQYLDQDALMGILETDADNSAVAVRLYAAIAEGKANEQREPGSRGVSQEEPAPDQAEEAASEEVTPSTEKTPDGEQTKAFATPPTFGKTARDQQPGVGKNGLDFTLEAPEADLFADAGNMIETADANPENEPDPGKRYEKAAARSEAVMDTAREVTRPDKTPNTVFVRLRGLDPGDEIGMWAAPYDGTAEDAASVTKGIMFYGSEEYQRRYSHRNSDAVATGTEGNAKFAISHQGADTVVEEVAQPKQAGDVALIERDRGYKEKSEHWQKSDAKWGKAKTIEQARNSLASATLGRDFGESMESYLARKPYVAGQYQATMDYVDGKLAAPAPPPPKKKTLIKTWNGEVRKVGTVFEVELKDGGTSQYPTEQEARKALFVAGAGKGSASAVADSGGAGAFTLQEARDGMPFATKGLGRLFEGQTALDVAKYLVKIKTKAQPFFNPTDFVDTNAAPPERFLKRVPVNIEALSNLLGGDPFRKQGFGGLDAKTQRLVVSDVVSLVGDKEIFDTVIQLIPVDVVNNLATAKITPEMFFHNPAMFKDAFSPDLVKKIPSVINVTNTLLDALALAGAIKESGLIFSDLVRPPHNGGAANATIDLDHAVSSWHKALLDDGWHNDTRHSGQSKATIETKETDAGVMMFETPAEYGMVKEGGPNAQLDLNFDAVPAGTGTPTNRKDGTGSSVSYFRAKGRPAVAVNLGTKTARRVDHVQTGTFRSGVKSVTSAADAAHVVASLRKNNKENFVVLTLDKNDAPIAILDISQGSLNASIVHPRETLGPILLTPGAKSVWFAHNHPSGDPTPSREDLELSARLADTLSGSGIDVRGSLSIGENGTFAGVVGATVTGSSEPTAAARNQSIPVMSGRVTPRPKGLQRMTSSTDANQVFRERGYGPGAAIVDSKNYLVGFVNMSPDAMRKLRTGETDSGASLLTKAVYGTGGAGMILHLTETGSLTDATRNAAPAVSNMVAFGEKLGVRVLDTIITEPQGAYVSLADRGLMDTDQTTFYQRQAFAPTYTSGTTQAEVEALFDAANFKGLRGSVVITQSVSQFPQGLQQAMQRDGQEGAAGVYWQGKIYIAADNVSPRGAQIAFLHEGRHAGLDRIFGTALDKRRFMAMVASAKSKEVNAWLKRYAKAGKDGGYTQAQRMEAAEEWLVDAVGRGEGGGIIDKFLAKVAQWVRSIFPNLKLTDAEIRSLVAGVDKLIIEGPSGARYVVGDQRYAGLDPWKWFRDFLTGDPVVALSGDEVPKFEKISQLVDWAGEFFKSSFGGVVTHKDLGDIVVDRRSAKNSLWHGIRRNKATAIAAIKDVLENGVVLSLMPGRQVDTVLVGAPITINGEKFVAVAQVRRDENTQRLYLHEVVSVEKLQGGFKTAASPEGDGPHGPNPGAIRTILQNIFTVNNDILYLRGGIFPSPSTLASASQQTRTAVDYLRMKFQDKFIPLLRVQEQLQAAGWVKTNDNDAYRAEELFHGKATKRLEDFYASNVQPLLDAIKGSSVSIAELEDYLYAKFAPQRNAYIASINPKLPEGGSGMTDREARQILADFAAAGKTADLERLARQVRAITSLQRQIIRDEGLELDETMDAWEANNPDYVPLKGGHEEQGKGIGTGFNVKRSGTKRALGRTSKAENILAELFAQTGATIVRAEKAKVGRAFLEMVEENPGDQWTVYDAAPTRRALGTNPAWSKLNKEIRVIKSMLRDPQYAGDVQALDALLQSKTSDLAATQEKIVQDVADQGFTQGDNVLTVTLDDGTVKYVELEDSDLARVMKNLTPNQYGAVTQVLAKTLRYLSMMSTSLNPEFMVTNFTRDIQTAMVNLSGEQSAKVAKDVLKGVPAAMKGIHNALRGDKQHPMAQWFARYQKAGAQVSFMDLRGMEAWQRKLENLGKEGKYGMEQARKLGMIISDYNGVIENAARLSAFKVAIESGMSESDAASLAKNLTVNFNRKGELGPAINALYMFANAGIQGSARILGALKHKNVRRIAGGTMVLAFLLAEANRLSGGDDDDDESKWDKISDFTKQTNFIFLRENGEMVKVRLPYGYNVFVAAGYALNDYMHNLNGKGGKNTLETAKFMASSVMNAFNPFGGDEGFLKILAPTLADPLLEIATNENFMGDKIRPDNLPFGAQKPDSELYFRSASGMSKAVAQTMNSLTGGNQWEKGAIDVSPETIDHLFGFALGGLGRSVGRLADVPGKALSGDLSVKDVPFLRQVYQQPTPYVDLDRFYTNVQKIEAARANLKQMEGPARKDFMARHPEIQLRVAAESHKKRMGSLRKRFYAARDAGRWEEARQFEKQMQQMALRFNKIYNARTQ